MHYEFTEEKLELRGMTAYRIRALVDMEDQDVKIGDLGGFVCKDSTLSKKVWVGGDATVWQSILKGEIRVDDNARVEKSTLTKRCQILEYATIFHSTIAGVYAKGECVIRESELASPTGEYFGFMVEGNASLKSCKMTYTANKGERIQFKGLSELVSCTVKGKRMEFEGNTVIKYSEIEGESLYFEDVAYVRGLKLKGKQVSFQRVKQMLEVRMEKVFQVDVVGALQIEHSSIEGESIVLRGDGIFIGNTSIRANLVKIRDSVELNHVNMEAFDIDLSDYVSLVGNMMDRVHIAEEVYMRDLVSVHIDKRKKSMSFKKKTLSGDVCLTGI